MKNLWDRIRRWLIRDFEADCLRPDELDKLEEDAG